MQQNLEKNFKIAFVGGADHPIPAIRGGAIQTLVTAILDKNESKEYFQIDIYTCVDDGLRDIKYKNAYIYQINHKSLLNRVEDFTYKLLRKILFNRLPYRNAFMTQVNAILKKRKYDAIIYETSDAEFLQVKRFHNEKIFFHIHSDYLNEKSYQIDKIINNCDYFIAVSNFIKKRLELVTNDKSKVIVLPNAIDVKRYQNEKEIAERSVIRKKYGFTENDNVIIFCGRLSHEKGCLELLQAAETIPNCKVLIVGGENFNSNIQTDYVKKLKVVANKMPDRVIFTGYINHIDIAKYMHAADIAVVPSVCNEASSLTLLEFRACGLPTIATNIGGIVENCNSESTIKVNLNNDFINNLRKAIELLCQNKDKRCSMKTFALLNIEAYDYETYYSNFCNMINKLCGGCDNGN